MASANGSASNGNGGTSYSSNYPILNQSVAGASGAGSSELKTVDSGPSQVLNGWDDDIDGWELQPSSYHAYGDNNNGNKALWGDTLSNSSGSGSFTKVKPSRKGGSSVSSSSTYSSRGTGRGSGSGSNRTNNNNNTSPRGRGTPPGRGAGRGKSFNGGRAKPNSAWGPNQNARQYEDHGAPATRAWEKAGAAPAPAIAPAPELNGWQHVGGHKSRNNGSDSSSRSGPGGQNSKAWHQGARATTQLVSTGSAGSSGLQGEGGSAEVYDYPASTYSDSQCSELDHMDDDSDDAFFSDDSYAMNAHEDEKKIKWFRDFFQDLDDMTDAQCSEHDRQWHCPACHGGPGAIDWFRGLAPLATHARTMRSRRVKLHRKFAEVLEEELRIRRAAPPIGGVGADAASLAFGKWKGLSEETEVQQPVLVIWPPIVIIQNTQLEQDDEGKWTGMGNKELVDMFKEYNPLKPRHAYGPQGHRGMSLLIFADSPAGYHDAVRLGNHFLNLRRGKDDWNRTSKLLCRPGGNRILYGYMGAKEDLDIFNRHSKGKTLVKFDVRRLQEVVLEPMQQMQQENKQMQFLQSEHNTLKNAPSKTSKNLQLQEEELKVLRERTEKQHVDNKRQLLDMEEYYHTQTAHWAEEVATKDTELQKLRNNFDKMYQSRCQELNAQRSNICNTQEQQTLMADDIQEKMKKVEGTLQEAQDFENKLEELEQKHHERRMQFQKQQHEAALAFEQHLKTERTEFLHTFEMQLQLQ